LFIVKKKVEVVVAYCKKLPVFAWRDWEKPHKTQKKSVSLSRLETAVSQTKDRNAASWASLLRDQPARQWPLFCTSNRKQHV